MDRYLCWANKQLNLFGYSGPYPVTFYSIWDEDFLRELATTDPDNVYWYTDVPTGYGPGLPLSGRSVDWSLLDRTVPQNGEQFEVTDDLPVVRKANRFYFLGRVHPSDRRRSSPSRFYHRYLRARQREIRDKRIRLSRPDIMAALPHRILCSE